MKGEKHEHRSASSRPRGESRGEQRARVTITSRDEADAALKEMRDLLDWVGAHQIIAEEKINDIREELVDKTKVSLKEITSLEKALQKWAEKDRENWEGKKTLELNFGSLSFRLSTPAIVFTLKKAAHVIERLKAHSLKHCVRVKESVDKDRLAAYPDDVLKEVGCRRVQKEEFYAEPKREEVKG